jgi:hypothetical protein
LLGDDISPIMAYREKNVKNVRLFKLQDCPSDDAVTYLSLVNERGGWWLPISVTEAFVFRISSSRRIAVGRGEIPSLGFPL